MHVKLSELVLVLLFLSSGCAVNLQPIKDSERSQQAQRDLDTMFNQQEPVDKEISLYEAMARALKYNMEHRVKLMERVVSANVMDHSRFDLLPKLALEAGYRFRDSENISRSYSLENGTDEVRESISQEHNQETAKLGVVWNILDFGVSYLRQKQLADQVLISDERRRKAVQNIIQEVRSTYWHVAAMEKVVEELKSNVRSIESALDIADQLQKGGLSAPLTALQYRRDLLRTLRTLVKKNDELALARADLAHLMNLPAGSRFSLSLPKNTFQGPMINATHLNRLQLAALAHRPELKEMDYRYRILKMEGKIERLQLLPGVSINLDSHYDSNKYLANQGWGQAGVQITHDLMKLASIKSGKRVRKSSEQLSNLRRKTLTVAVLSQVELAVRTYVMAARDYQFAVRATDIEEQRRLQFQAKRSSGVAVKLDVVQASADKLLSQLDQYAQFAQMQSGYGLLLNSLGVDPLPSVVEDHDLATLTEAMEQYFTVALPKILENVMTPVESKPLKAG